MNVPQKQQQQQQPQHSSAAQHARSPPQSSKHQNLALVPCKFYRQGACTAGRNCVFSHTVEPEQDRAPCKYFQKGNCRFGAKCALAHILPDGRRVNHMRQSGGHGSTGNAGPGNANVNGNAASVGTNNGNGSGVSAANGQGFGLNIGPRINPTPFGAQPSGLSSGIHAELLQSQSQTQTPRDTTLLQSEEFPALQQQQQKQQQLQQQQTQARTPQGQEVTLNKPIAQRFVPAFSEQAIAYQQEQARQEYFSKNPQYQSELSTQQARENEQQARQIRQNREPQPPSSLMPQNSYKESLTKTLGPLDAQLPPSLDSNGLSYFAKYGPVAASVPHTSQFGIPERFDSFPSSPLPHPQIQPSSLYAPGSGLSGLSSSPRAGGGSGNLSRAMFERRASSIIDPSVRDQISNSVPTSRGWLGGGDETWSPKLRPQADEDTFTFEEDFVPSSLNELLTPMERQRRLSSSREERPDRSERERDGTQHLSTSATGSTSGSPSSSRFGALFLKHKQDPNAQQQPRNSPGNLPPIGSPLARGLNRSGAVSPTLLSPPRTTLSGLRSMSTSQRSISGISMDMGELKVSTTDEDRRKGSDDEQPFEMDI